MQTRPKFFVAAVATVLALVACETETAEDAPETPAPTDSSPADKAGAAQSTVDGKADWGFDLCEKRGWYGDAECDWFCPKPDPDCDLAPLGPEPAGSPTRHPIVLGHGFDASPTNRWGFYKVAQTLGADGHAVHVAEVPPYDAVEIRAAYLARHIDAALAETGADKVNLVSHSMGGLDARYVVSVLGYADRVASVTTLSTPHRGSAVADVALGLMPGPLDAVVNALASAWGRSYSDVANDSHVRAAMEAISEEGTAAFNLEVKDASGVKYLSWAGVSSVLGLANTKDQAACGKLLRHPGTSDRMHATLLPMAPFTAHGTRLLPNDGMVTVESAKWGEFQGCFPADHLDEVGQPRHDGPDAHTGFDHLRFYRNLAFDLAARGF